MTEPSDTETYAPFDPVEIVAGRERGDNLGARLEALRLAVKTVEQAPYYPVERPMTFLNRGRPIFGGIGRPSEPAPEPVAAVTGLPVAAPDPEGGTDDLSPSTQLNRASLLRLEERLACVHELRSESVGSETFLDGRPADKLWVVSELERLEDLADLAERHWPWAAAQRMYGGTR